MTVGRIKLEEKKSDNINNNTTAHIKNKLNVVPKNRVGQSSKLILISSFFFPLSVPQIFPFLQSTLLLLLLLSLCQTKKKPISKNKKTCFVYSKRECEKNL